MTSPFSLTRALRRLPLLRLAAGLGLLIAVAPARARAESGPTVQMSPPGDRNARFSVVGLEPAVVAALSAAGFDPEQYRSLFAVYTVPAGSSGTSPTLPILGRYRIDAGALHFQPRFPLEPGLVYQARFDPAKLPAPAHAASGGPPPVLVAEFALPRKDASAPARIVAVYPSADRLPENLLKLYLHFSAPMSRGMVYEHVQIRDASGKSVAFPFVELAEELWDPRGERLTLLFNPGRIKSGLKPREELGPIFRAGERYTLVIDRGWLDAAGQPLASEYRKTFTAGPTDDQPPDPATWVPAAPAAGTRAPLAITFPEPLDHAMLGRVLGVNDGAGKSIAGAVSIDTAETRWLFTPERPWQAGAYRVVVDRDLEDLAGNSVGRPFEVDVFDKVERKAVAETVSIPFRVDLPPR